MRAHRDGNRYTQIDTEGVRFVLGDAQGHITILVFDLNLPQAGLFPIGQVRSQSSCWIFDRGLHKVSPPTSMTLLSSQYIYVGSHYGDAQLLRILPDRSSHSGTFLEIVEN